MKRTFARKEKEIIDFHDDNQENAGARFRRYREDVRRLRDWFGYVDAPRAVVGGAREDGQPQDRIDQKEENDNGSADFE